MDPIPLSSKGVGKILKESNLKFKEPVQSLLVRRNQVDYGTDNIIQRTESDAVEGTNAAKMVLIKTTLKKSNRVKDIMLEMSYALDSESSSVASEAKHVKDLDTVNEIKKDRFSRYDYKNIVGKRIVKDSDNVKHKLQRTASNYTSSEMSITSSNNTSILLPTNPCSLDIRLDKLNKKLKRTLKKSKNGIHKKNKLQLEELSDISTGSLFNPSIRSSKSLSTFSYINNGTKSRSCIKMMGLRSIPPSLGAYMMSSMANNNNSNSETLIGSYNSNNNMNDVNSSNTISQDVLHKWMDNYIKEKDSYSSFSIFAETKLDDYRLFNISFGSPNIYSTAIACDMLFTLSQQTGKYEKLLQHIFENIMPAIYASIETLESSNTNAITTTSGTTNTTSTATIEVSNTQSNAYAITELLKRNPFFVSQSSSTGNGSSDIGDAIYQLPQVKVTKIACDVMAMKFPFNSKVLLTKIKDHFKHYRNNTINSLLLDWIEIIGRDDAVHLSIIHLLEMIDPSEREKLFRKLWSWKFFDTFGNPTFKQYKSGYVINSELLPKVTSEQQDGATKHQTKITESSSNTTTKSREVVAIARSCLQALGYAVGVDSTNTSYEDGDSYDDDNDSYDIDGTRSAQLDSHGVISSFRSNVKQVLEDTFPGMETRAKDSVLGGLSAFASEKQQKDLICGFQSYIKDTTISKDTEILELKDKMNILEERLSLQASQCVTQASQIHRLEILLKEMEDKSIKDETNHQKYLSKLESQLETGQSMIQGLQKGKNKTMEINRLESQLEYLNEIQLNSNIYEGKYKDLGKTRLQKENLSELLEMLQLINIGTGMRALLNLLPAMAKVQTQAMKATSSSEILDLSYHIHKLRDKQHQALLLFPYVQKLQSEIDLLKLEESETIVSLKAELKRLTQTLMNMIEPAADDDKELNDDGKSNIDGMDDIYIDHIVSDSDADLTDGEDENNELGDDDVFEGDDNNASTTTSTAIITDDEDGAENDLEAKELEILIDDAKLAQIADCDNVIGMKESGKYKGAADVVKDMTSNRVILPSSAEITMKAIHVQIIALEDMPKMTNLSKDIIKRKMHEIKSTESKINVLCRWFKIRNIDISEQLQPTLNNTSIDGLRLRLLEETKQSASQKRDELEILIQMNETASNSNSHHHNNADSISSGSNTMAISTSSTTVSNMNDDINPNHDISNDENVNNNLQVIGVLRSEISKLHERAAMLQYMPSLLYLKDSIENLKRIESENFKSVINNKSKNNKKNQKKKRKYNNKNSKDGRFSTYSQYSKILYESLEGNELETIEEELMDAFDTKSSAIESVIKGKRSSTTNSLKRSVSAAVMGKSKKQGGANLLNLNSKQSSDIINKLSLELIEIKKRMRTMRRANKKQNIMFRRQDNRRKFNIMKSATTLYYVKKASRRTSGNSMNSEHNYNNNSKNARRKLKLNVLSNIKSSAGDRYISMILSKFGRNIARKMRNTVKLIRMQRLKRRSVSIGSSGYASGTNRITGDLKQILPQFEENLIKLFRDKLNSDSSNLKNAKCCQTDFDQEVNQGATTIYSTIIPSKKSGINDNDNNNNNNSFNISNYSNTVSDSVVSIDNQQHQAANEVALTRRSTRKLSNMLQKILKKSKQGQGRSFVRLDPSMLPITFRNLISSWKMKTKTLEQYSSRSIFATVKIIGEVLTDKLNHNFAADGYHMKIKSIPLGEKIHEDEGLAESIHRRFLNLFGLPAIADVNMVSFALCLEIYRQDNIRVDLFTRIAFGEVPLQLQNIYLRTLHMALMASVTESDKVKLKKSKNKKLKHHKINKNEVTMPNVIDSTINLKDALDIFENICDSFPPESYNLTEEKIREICSSIQIQSGENSISSNNNNNNNEVDNLHPILSGNDSLNAGVVDGSSVAVLTPPAVTTTSSTNDLEDDVPVEDLTLFNLSLDKLLMTIIEAWEAEFKRRKTFVKNLFKAGDVDADGDLTTSEFSAAVRSLNPNVKSKTSVLMHSQALRLSGSSNLSPDVFVKICSRFGLLSKWWITGNLFGIVNSTEDIISVWKKTAPFCLGTLEHLKRDLPSNHTLRRCQIVGDGCLSCIEDQVRGFMDLLLVTSAKQQGVSTPTTTNSTDKNTMDIASIEWQTYWMIIRCISEAAALCNGVRMSLYSSGDNTSTDGVVVQGANNSSSNDAVSKLPISTTKRSLNQRRKALPLIFMPNTDTICSTIDEFKDDIISDTIASSSPNEKLNNNSFASKVRRLSMEISNNFSMSDEGAHTLNQLRNDSSSSAKNILSSPKRYNRRTSIESVTTFTLSPAGLRESFQETEVDLDD